MCTLKLISYPPQVLGLGQTGPVLPIKKHRFSGFLSSDADSGRCRSAFRADADHSFRGMAISDSGGCRSIMSPTL
jgi:hypothetical protein